MPALFEPITRAESFRRVTATDFTDAAYPSRVATLTDPAANAGAIKTPLDGGNAAANWLLFLFFGTGADNTTAKVKLLGWAKVLEAGGVPLWVPVELVEVTVTFSQAVGVAGSGTVLDTHRFADTLVATSGIGNVNVDYVVSSPADNTPGWLMADAKGFPLVELIGNLNGSSTNFNALYKRL